MSEKNGTIAYPGTFDPLTHGHESMVRRALHVFDKVVVAVAAGVHKDPVFSLAERIEMIEETFDGQADVTVRPVEGLLADFLAANDIKVVLRGMRSVSDFEFEIQLADINRRLGHSVETLFMVPDNDYIHVFSRVVREVAMLGGNVSHYVNPGIAARLKERFSDVDLKDARQG